MKANELRIGNFVDTGSFHLPRYRGIYEVKEEWFKWSRKFKPIEITDEWMINFGFKKTESKWELNEIEISSWFTFRFSETPLKVQEINYVHQLQNLYFALTGLELNIA